MNSIISLLCEECETKHYPGMTLHFGVILGDLFWPLPDKSNGHLAEQRHRRMSQAEFARHFGISAPAMSRMLNSRTPPRWLSHKDLRRMADILGCTEQEYGMLSQVYICSFLKSKGLLDDC